MPVEDNLASSSELERVDAYWSSVWEGRDLNPMSISDEIENCDEFKVINSFIQKLPGNARVLDGGCGMGQWVVYLKSKGLLPIGLDISSSTIERLEKAFPDNEWQVGDINNLDFPDNSLDAYLSWGTFEHFEHGLLPPIQEAYRVLKPGGWLFTSVPHDSLRLFAQKHMGNWIDSVSKENRQQSFYQWRLTKREIAFEITREKFEINSISAIHKQEGVGRLFRSITGLTPSGPIKGRIVNGLARLMPGGIVGHMLLVVAQKPL